MSIIESFLIGIISGFVSSVIVTQIYRQIDKKQNRLEYICELLFFANEFENVLFYAGNVEIEDEYIKHAYRFVIDNTLPVKKKWVKLKKDEKETCNNFTDFYCETLSDIMMCYLNMHKVQKGEVQYIQDVYTAKVKLSTLRHLEAVKYKSKLIDMRRKYAK